MASVEELNKAIDVIRNHCKYQSKAVDGCNDCVLSKFCEDCWNVPCWWESVNK